MRSDTMRAFTATMLLLLAAAPLAMAEGNETDKTNETPERPDDAAWVEDCPPDMMCAYGDEPQSYGPEDCIECSRGPADGSCENCRGDGAVEPEGSTCMDGAQEHEICDREVQYLDGGPGPTEGGELRAEDDTTRSVPGASFGVVVGALAVAIFVAARRP